MTGLALALHQFRYDQKIFWRNPASVFFTVMFPVMFLVLLGVIVNGQTIHAQGGIDATTYFVPAVITLALVSATMVNLAMNLTKMSEGGVLKRLRPVAVFDMAEAGLGEIVSVRAFGDPLGWVSAVCTHASGATSDVSTAP